MLISLYFSLNVWIFFSLQVDLAMTLYDLYRSPGAKASARRLGCCKAAALIGGGLLPALPCARRGRQHCSDYPN
ncbi:hypothetical protein ACRAWD_24015 [Caulobacter segnis]